MRINKLAPVLVVPEIERCLPFWVERLGFSVQAEVKHEDALGFVLLGHDGVEVMLQSQASLAKDMPGATQRDRETSICLYFDVDDLDAAERAMAGVEVVVPRRTTFYGAHELGVRDPAGNLIMLAYHAA